MSPVNVYQERKFNVFRGKMEKKKKKGKNVKHTFILTGVMLLVTPGS